MESMQRVMQRFSQSKPRKNQVVELQVITHHSQTQSTIQMDSTSAFYDTHHTGSPIGHPEAVGSPSDSFAYPMYTDTSNDWAESANSSAGNTHHAAAPALSYHSLPSPASSLPPLSPASPLVPSPTSLSSLSSLSSSSTTSSGMGETGNSYFFALAGGTDEPSTSSSTAFSTSISFEEDEETGTVGRAPAAGFPASIRASTSSSGLSVAASAASAASASATAFRRAVASINSWWKRTVYRRYLIPPFKMLERRVGEPDDIILLQIPLE
ncbi:hypothetical protein HK102_004713 [Quaeritorhiza haematococci]|nr:hypothetical protein HK102_004713 [Quaeritorhiza haematococci]